ncbi:hypothetical protein GH5_05598 [Leishmania sp. Ghana 2012 LV757]|uniref:hypothetical protein n=1 Tax=Leishmania sp. Ghana 2012 LV757 TaxID=2803181 RepID=UPI001B4C2798|nr:hypothetical protein GH5_05598 [Leishmania sp. Ghana 2012 LV757]
MMQNYGGNAIASVTPSVAKMAAMSGAQASVSSWMSPDVTVGTSSFAERDRECSSGGGDTLGAEAALRVLPADALAMLVAAIKKYVHRRMAASSAIDDAVADESRWIKNSSARKKFSSTSASGATQSTLSPRLGTSDDGVEEVHLITSTQQLEAHLLRCLLHVHLIPCQLPNQPEVIGEVFGTPGVTIVPGTTRKSPQVQRPMTSVVTSMNEVASAEGADGEQSPPPRHPSVLGAGEKHHPTESAEGRSRSQRSSATAAAASATSSPRPRASSGGIKAKELYYTYTSRGVPSLRLRPHGEDPVGAATASPMRSSSCSNGEAATAEMVKKAQEATTRRRRAGRQVADASAVSWDSANSLPPKADSSGGALPEHSRNLPAFPCTCGGTVRPLYATEIRAALRSWPSRIAQYVLATTLAKQELRSAAGDADGVTNAGAPAEPGTGRGDAPASNTHEEGRASASEPLPVGEDAEENEIEADVVIDVIVRRLCSVLDYTRLIAGTSGTRVGEPPAVVFPSFARFYLADVDAEIAAHGSGVHEGGNAHLYLARLVDVLLSTQTRGGDATGAGGPAQHAEVEPTRKLGLSGDIATDIGWLLKHTPLVTVPRHPSASPADKPALGMADINFASPLLTARSSVWCALRSLLHLSPSSLHNPTICTTPLVVGIVRRYSSSRTPTPTTSNGADSGGESLRVRFLPVADLFHHDVATAAAAEPAPDGHLRGSQHAAHNRPRTPAFYNAVLLEVTGEDVLHSVATHADAVALEEESESKVRYDADVPEAYRDRHRRRMGAQNRSGFESNLGASAWGTNEPDSATALSVRHRCLSGRECALWEKLLGLTHFVHVSGTPAEVETTARYVTLVIRRRRGARQQSQRDPRQVSSASSSPVSIAESTALPSVPAFFFTLTETSALRSAAAAVVEARQLLFGDRETSDDRDAVPAHAAQGARAKAGSAPSTAAAAGRASFFFGGSGLGLRALLGWGKGAAAATPGQPTPANASPQDGNRSSNIRMQPCCDERQCHLRAPSTEPLSPSVREGSTEELIMEWMYDVLIPLFFETTVSVSEDVGPAGAAAAGRRRAPYHLRSQRVLLGRVQAVTPSMVYGGSFTTSSSSTVALACDTEPITEAVVRDSMFDADLITYLLLNQLFFTPDGSLVDTAHDAGSSPARRASSAPLPERTPENTRSVAAASPHSPNAQARRVSFLEDASTPTPPRLATSLSDPESGAGSPLLQPSSTPANPTLPRRSSSVTGSPRSILKSGRRYKREKLIRSSAPATSVVPFRNLFLWRCLATEILSSGDSAHGASAQQQQQHQKQQPQEGLGDISSVSTSLCITSAAYLRYTQALAVRVASEAATAVLLASLLAEQHACCRQLQGQDKQLHRVGSSSAPECAHGGIHRGAEDIRKACSPRDAPAEGSAGGAQWRPLACDDLLTLASGAALAFVRAALAPILCKADANPARLADVAAEVGIGIDFSDAFEKGETTPERRGDADSASDTDDEQCSADDTRCVGGHHGRASEAAALSLLTPSLPVDVSRRLHTLCLVCLLHVRLEVLETVTRPLDAVLRSLTWALARHRLRDLCRPLDNFLRSGSAAALLHGADGSAQRVHAERQLWQLVRQALDLYEGCLVLPHIFAGADAALLATVPTASMEVEKEQVASEAVVKRRDGGSMADAQAREEPYSVLSEEESTSPLTARTDVGIPKPRLSSEQQEQQQLLSSAQRGRAGFVPLSFGSTSFDSAHPSTISTVRRTALQPAPSQKSLTRPVDPSDSYDLHSSALDLRAMRLASPAVRGAGSSDFGGAASDFVEAAASLLALRRLTPFTSPHAGGMTPVSQMRAPLEAGTGIEASATEPVMGGCLSDGSGSGNAISAAAPISRARQPSSKRAFDDALAFYHGHAGNASRDSDTSPQVHLLLSPPTALDVPALAAPDTTDSRSLDGFPLGLFDANAAAPLLAGSPAGRYEESPRCADFSGSEASQRRRQHACVPSHPSSFLTLTYAVPLLRRLQTVVSSAGEGNREDAGEGERQPRTSPRPPHGQPPSIPCQEHTPRMRARENGDAATGSTAQADGKGSLSPKGGANVAASVSATSETRPVIQVRSGIAVESPLLSPFVAEAKRVMVAALLERWVLPWWAQLTLRTEQETAEAKRGHENNGAHAGDTRVVGYGAVSTPSAQPGIHGGCRVRPPTDKVTASTDPAASCERLEKSVGVHEVTPSAAPSQLAKQVVELKRENSELHSRLHNTQRLLAAIHQACSGLCVASRQYEMAVAVQNEKTKRAVTAAATDSNMSLAGCKDTVTLSRQLNLVSPSPLSSAPQVVLGKGDVGVSGPHDEAARAKVMGEDSAAAPPLADRVPPNLLYFAQTEEGRERVAELCERIVVLLSGAADPEDERDENAEYPPPSAIACDSDLLSQPPSSTSALATSHGFLLRSLSKGMQGSQCPSPPEPTSADLAATAALRRDNSMRHRHSVVSREPSQLYAPLEPQPFRRTSTAFTLVSLAPAGALTMSSTIAPETPCSTPTSTPVAVLIVGASRDPSLASSPVQPLRPNSVQQQHMQSRLIAWQHAADPSFSADVGVPSMLMTAYPEATSVHVSSSLRSPGSTPPLLRRASPRTKATQAAPPVSPSLELVGTLVASSSSVTSLAASTQMRNAPPQRRSSSVDNVEVVAHTPDEQQHSNTSSSATPSVALGDSHGTQDVTPLDNRRRRHSSRGGSGNGNSAGRQAPSSTLSSSPVDSAYSARPAPSAVEPRGLAALPSLLPLPLSPASLSLSAASSEAPTESSLMFTTTAVHTRTFYDPLIREDDVYVQDNDIADAAAAAAAADAPKGKEDVSLTPVDKESRLLEGERTAPIAVGSAECTRKPVDVSADASHADPAGGLLEQAGGSSDPKPRLCSTSSSAPRVLMISSLWSLQYHQPTALLLRQSQDLVCPTTRDPGSVSVETRALQHTDSGVATHDDRQVAACDAGEVGELVKQGPTLTKATTLQVHRTLSPKREGGVGGNLAPASPITSEQAVLPRTTTTAVSSSPLREPTPARSSEAAVTALADLQRRLSGSSSVVTELRQQLQQAEEELCEKEAAMARLAEHLAATEAALRAAQCAAALAGEAQQPLQRLFTPPPPPLRASVSTSTAQLLPLPFASSTPWREEREKEVNGSGVTSTPANAADGTSQLKEPVAGTAAPTVGEPTATAAPGTAVSAATSPPLSAGSSPQSPSSLHAQLRRRVHELEDELRNAHFRMDQWRALLDAERHAHTVQVDQLTHQLGNEQRRRVREGRSRSRSLSPPGSDTVPLPYVESLARDETRAAPLPAPPPLAPLPPKVERTPQLSSMSGDVALLPASRRDRHGTQLQQRIDDLTEKLHVAEAHAIEERAQRDVAEMGIRALEREQRVLRERLEAQGKEWDVAQVQQRQQAHDAAWREKTLRREVKAHMQALATMQAEQAASEETQRRLAAELDAERRARATAVAEDRAARDRLAHESEEQQRLLRCERDKAMQREKEAVAQAAAESQAAQAQIAALRQRIESTAEQLRAAEAESGEQRDRCIIAETQAAALESARKELADRVMVLEEELSGIRAAQKQWQQDTDERERALRQEYEETAVNAGAAMEAQRRASSEQVQRCEDELRAMRHAQAVSDEAHRAAFEDVTRKLEDAEQATRLAADDLRRERETHERTTAALREFQSENAALRQRVDAVLEKLHLAEVDADERCRQRELIGALEEELEAARAQQQDRLQGQLEAAKKCEDALRRELETHVRTIAKLQEDQSASDELRRRLEDELQSEKLARAADAAMHKVALADAQGQVSCAEQRTRDSDDALQRKEREHARTLAAMQAVQEANTQLQRSRAAQEVHIQQCTRSWWSAREACALQWMEAKTLLVADAWCIKCAELQLQLHAQRLQRREGQPQQTPSLVSPSPTSAGSPPVGLKQRKEKRLGREKRRDEPSAPGAAATVPAASGAPVLQSEIAVLSVDDPLGLRYELQRKTRHINSLEERVRQLEEAHRVDQRVMSTLQQLAAQEETLNGKRSAAASGLPPPPSRECPARDAAWAEGFSTPTSLPGDPCSDIRGSAGSPPGTTERKRLTPNEYRQRYAWL